MPDKVKQRKELLKKIDNMEPNTTITIGATKIEYHKTKDLIEHYLVSNIAVRVFPYKHEVVDYMLKQIQNPTLYKH